MRIRVEGDTARLVEWLEEQGYPYREGHWTYETLQDYSIMVRLEEWDGFKAETFGYIWATWLSGSLTTMDFHACVAKSHRLRWFGLMPDLEKLASFLGAERLYTQTPGDPDRARLMGELLIRKFGYTRVDSRTVYKNIG